MRGDEEDDRVDDETTFKIGMDTAGVDVPLLEI